MRGELETAAPFIGIAIVLDMLDGRIARPTGTASGFGCNSTLRMRFRSAWRRRSSRWRGARAAGRLGRAAGFIYVSAAALRLARFNIQSASARRQALLRRHAEPRGGGIIASTVYVSPWAARLPRGAAGAGADVGARAADGQHDPLPQLQDARPADASASHGAAGGARHHGGRHTPALRRWSAWPTRTSRRPSSDWC